MFVSKEQTGSGTANTEQYSVAILPTKKSPSTVSSKIVGHANATLGPGTSVDATVPVDSEEVEIANMSVKGVDDILPTSVLTEVFIKNCNRQNLAVQMIWHLIDKEIKCVISIDESCRRLMNKPTKCSSFD